VPTYEYVCLSCARRVDVLHGIHVDGPSTCEVCGGQLRKAISAAAVVFKGSGWAKKDAARAARPSTEKGGSDGSTTDAERPKDKTPIAGTEPDTVRPSTPDGKAGSSDKAPTKDPGGSTAATPGAKGQTAGSGERRSTGPRSGE
jgi:putative FmdB family regulatory protein